MKPSKPVKFNPKSKSFHFEVNAVAADIGLVLECPDYPEMMYYNDTVSGRKFRILESLEIEMSDDNFDRWANSGMLYEKLPMTDVKFKELIEYMRTQK
jgi:hypothetical protein